jgi:hypothetical protein
MAARRRTAEIDLMLTQPCRRFRRNEASAYLKATWGIERKSSTLAKYASLGGGPKYEYVGRVPLYQQDQLDIWARSIFSPLCGSTTDKPEPLS